MILQLTPMQELIVDTLLARARLGEDFWTFKNSGQLQNSLKKLEEHGFVYQLSGVVEKTTRVGLTLAGKVEFQISSYVSPLEREKIDLLRDVEELRRLRSRGYEV